MKEEFIGKILGKVILFHGISSLILYLCCVLLPSVDEKSALFGAGIIGLNLFILVWSWQLIFFKKSIALAASVIVIKYAILGIVIYSLFVDKLVELYGFLIGMSSMILTVMLLALSYFRLLKKEK